MRAFVHVLALEATPRYGMTKAQIDRLGDRLRTGLISETDLRLLHEYRRSFANAYEGVVGVVQAELGRQPTGRPAKSTSSIIDKLRRESIRLSQMQDIAGCRFVVSGVVEEQQAVDKLSTSFEDVTVVDRRKQPSHGYRAVHIIAFVDAKPIEIQLRTRLQHLWAELSEKLSDLIHPDIKYGKGDEKTVSTLAGLSQLIAQEEDLELVVASTELELSKQIKRRADTRELAKSVLHQLTGSSLSPQQLAAKQLLEKVGRDNNEIDQEVTAMRESVRAQSEQVQRLTEKIGAYLSELIKNPPSQKGDSSALPD